VSQALLHGWHFGHPKFWVPTTVAPQTVAHTHFAHAKFGTLKFNWRQVTRAGVCTKTRLPASQACCLDGAWACCVLWPALQAAQIQRKAEGSREGWHSERRSPKQEENKAGKEGGQMRSCMKEWGGVGRPPERESRNSAGSGKWHIRGKMVRCCSKHSCILWRGGRQRANKARQGQWCVGWLGSTGGGRQALPQLPQPFQASQALGLLAGCCPQARALLLLLLRLLLLGLLLA
jgi:hypothetical protein